MNETEASQELSPREISEKIYEQVRKLARIYPQINHRSMDENFTILNGPAVTFNFHTTELNISKTETPEGAYPNDFTFSFEPDQLIFTYLEFHPSRSVTTDFNVKDYPTTQEFKAVIVPFMEKFNLLLEYFGKSERISVPS